jgi:hypothetical protein
VRKALFTLLVAGASLALPSACSPEATPQETVLRFQQAVQDGDFDALFCLSAGAPGAEELGADPQARREGFAAWAAARLGDYESGREEGHVEPAGDGILTVKLLALGRGTFYRFEPPRQVDGGAVRLPASLTLGYPQLDLSRLSPGTTFYLCGAPFGTVHAVRVPSGAREVRLEVLDRITIEWSLLRQDAADGCPAGWAVAGVAPVPGTERTTTVTWVF